MYGYSKFGYAMQACRVYWFERMGVAVVATCVELRLAGCWLAPRTFGVPSVSVGHTLAQCTLSRAAPHPGAARTVTWPLDFNDLRTSDYVRCTL